MLLTFGLIYIVWKDASNKAIVKYLRDHITYKKKDVSSVDEFVLRPDYDECSAAHAHDKKLIFIAFVVIAPNLFEQRRFIRSTWGNTTLFPEMRIVFSLGMTANATLNAQIADEFSVHKDILQIGTFNDSYYVMTTKLMKTFKWISIYCTNAMYILRLNDDVIVNMFNLLVYFKELPYKKRRMYGRAVSGYPNRDTNNKFFIPKNLYGIEKYPDYPDGNLFNRLLNIGIKKL